MSDEPSGGFARVRVQAVAAGEVVERGDRVAVEEPLEVRLLVEQGGRLRRHSIAVTMRTPGQDFELAAGFLYGEGILPGEAALAGIAYCRSGTVEEARNVVEVTLVPGAPFDPERFSRHVYTTSSCGVCGRASLEAVRASLPAPAGARPAAGPRVERRTLLALPERLGEAQAVFAVTGGLHAAALFDAAGGLELVREDVGRHNAVDKVVGALLLEGRLPAGDRLLMVSGRASFELVQKAVMAGLPLLAAVGAPSSLAVDLARQHGLTLVGFLRDGRFNLYSGEGRLAAAGDTGISQP